MAHFIGIETGTAVCSVALFEGDRLLAIREEEGRVHSEKTAFFIRECLEEVGLLAGSISAVGISIGPGSYTGLRVGLSVAKGYCYGADLSLIAIDSLEILAAASKEKCDNKEGDLFCPMIDARRMEVYLSFYNQMGEQLGDMRSEILSEEFFEKQSGKASVWLSGDGADKAIDLDYFPSQWKDSGVRSSAMHMGSLIKREFDKGNTSSIAYTIPKYLKKPNITQSKKTLF